jgi:ABC-2 type transport system permease protein
MMGFTALVRLSWRQLLGWHRLGLWMFLGVLGALPVFVMAVILASAQFDPDLPQRLLTEEFRTGLLRALFDGFQLPLLYPVIALLLTATVLREEIQNETILYLWVKPLSRSTLVISKYAVALLGTLILSGLSAFITGAMIVNDWAMIGKLVFTVAIALLAYGAFFFALSMIFERALIWGFVYVLGWEWLFSRISSAASQLSIRHYAENLERNLFGSPSELSLATSLGVLLGLVLVFLGLAIWRFSRMEFAAGGEAG